MQNELVSRAAGVSDSDLLRRVAVLATREREATVELVGHLAELDARRLHVAEGYGSLFAYCTGSLRLAEHAAYNRIEAARLSRRFPAVLDLLSDGSLNLSTARLLAPHLRPDNFETLVAQARGRSKREVETLVAQLAPRPDVPPSVRRLPSRLATAQAPEPRTEAGAQPDSPAPRPGGGQVPEQGTTQGVEGGPLTASPPASIAGPAAHCADGITPPARTTADFPGLSLRETIEALPRRPTERPVVAPLAAERYRVQFTVGTRTHEKLRRAQELLRREIPDGDPGAIFDRALTLLLEDFARKKLAVTSKPRHSPCVRTGSRHIPARVKRAVWLRDGGRCAFIATHGRRCAERTILEFHHREPYAIGGEATVANISLRCRAHNAYEARLAFATEVPVSALAVVPEALKHAAGRLGDPLNPPRSRSLNSPRGELRRDGDRCLRP